MHGTPPDGPSSALTVAQAVADDSVKVAHQLKRGELVAAMDQLIALIDELAGFLSSIDHAVRALQICNPQLAQACVQYQQRIDALLVRIDEALVARDLVALALALEHGVAKALRDFSYFDGPVRQALAPSQGVAA